MSHRIRVRAAEAGDAETIHRLLLPFAERQVLLPRTKDDIYQHLQEFLVAELDNHIVGTVAMHIYGTNLAEIRSLVVERRFQGMAAGRLLVEGCEKWAAGLGVAQLFALTYVPEFFMHLGYVRVAKESLPHKIWTVCVHCAKFADCDEVAVQKRLVDAPIEPMRLPPIVELRRD